MLLWVTLFWMIYEVGFDKWQWIPRGDILGLIGVWLAMPWVVRPLTGRKFHPFLGSTLIIIVALVIGMMFYDPLPQEGTITNARQPADAAVAHNDWAAYGGTSNGLRFSALNQINKQNVKDLEVARPTTPETCVRATTPANIPLKPRR